MRRFPRTLFRTITSELSRLVLTSTAAIVCVLAFGAALKPLADGEIGPDDTVRLMILAIIPMLQYALPFACSFAATMTFHRFANENEADAAMASGIPHRTLLAPAIAVGLALCVGIGALMMSVIPNFLREIEGVITRNVTEILIARIERGESIAVGNFQIYADDVRSTGPDPIDASGTGSGAFERLLLTGVLAVQTGDASGETTAINARRVVMWFFDEPDDAGNAIAVQLLFEDASSIDSAATMTTSVRTLNSQRIRIPGQFRDEPKFLTYRELQETRKDPSRMSWVNASRRVLAMRLAQQRAMAALDESLRTTGRAEFITGDDQRVRIAGRGLEPDEQGWRILTRGVGTGIAIEVTQDNTTPREYTASDAIITAENDEATWRSGEWTNSYTIEARNLTVRPPGDDPDAIPNNLGDREIARLRAPDAPETELLTLTGEELLEQARNLPPLPASLESKIESDIWLLDVRLVKLHNEILSREHERAAFAVSSLLMVIAGGVIGFKLRHALPLPVYLWSFFPALVSFVSISSGRQYVEEVGASGLPWLWAGPAFIAALVIFEFTRLRRH